MSPKRLVQLRHKHDYDYSLAASSWKRMTGPSSQQKRHVGSGSPESVDAHKPESGVKPIKHRRSRNLTISRVMRFCLPRPTGSLTSTTDRLPLFGSLRSYVEDHDSKLQEMLWELEVGRFIRIVNGTEDMLVPVLKPDSNEAIRSSLTRQNSKQLQVLANRILSALHVYVIDDNLLLEQSLDNTRPSKRFSESYWALRQAWGEEADLPGHRSHSYDPDKTRNPDYMADDQEDATEDQHRDLDELEVEQCYYLVDQVTATLAFLAVRGRDNDYWLVVVLACLAKFSTKIKFLVREFSKNVAICFRKSKHSPEPPGPEFLRDDDDARQPLNDNSPTHTRYCREVAVVSAWLTDCFKRILRDLGAQSPVSATSGSVDVCTIVYPAGVAGTRTLLCQGRHGEISGSPGLTPVASASNCLTIVDKLSSILSSRAHVPPSEDKTTDQTTGDRSESTSTSTSEPDVVLVVELDRHNEDPDGKERFEHVRRQLTIRTLIDFVAITTCLSLCHPEVGIGFQRSLQTISALSAFKEPEDHESAATKGASTKSDEPTGYTPSTKAGTDFYAFVNLCSGNAEDIQQSRVASSLSKSVVAAIRHNVLDRQLSPLNRPGLGKSATRNPQEAIAALNEAQAKRERLKNIIRKWKIQESSIVVECPDFVVRVSLFSAALVFGGLACGFLVGERITGVDPFNLTMFSWIIAGFVILIAKSVRVSDWTWRDFLFRQVTCRTVKEVADVVSGLDEQDLLCFLLSSEIRSTLKTRGPFRGVFCNIPGDGGFSIDVKPDLQTLFAAGVIPVMVQTLEGPALRFLRLVPGFNGHNSVEMSGQCTGFVCTDPPDESVNLGLPNEGQIGEAIVFYERVSWMKVLGVYNATGVSFR